MVTKFVSLVAVVVFSFSAFAQKAREIAPETKAKMESISKLKGKEVNDQIIKDLLNAEYKGKAQEKLQNGLDSIFGKEEILAKVEFAGRLKTLLDSSDVSTKNSGRHMRGLLERFSDMSDASVQDVVKRLLKNSDISMSEVASTYEAQLAATNLLTYKLFVKNDKSIDANTIELVGIANVMKSELPNIKGEGKSNVITSLKDLTAEQRKAVEAKRDEWKNKCNS
ncbi:MAG: hypothetical protein B7Y39_01705 [Bdellovibrio sp. 28-41-41]|nr:MAG: hypothetical protein B7Y39_01705 [Bdellovibrio sp. 28-41-41]